MTLGDQIRAERVRRGLSQSALGKAVGISQPAIKKIEDGQTQKSKFLQDLLDYLGLGRHTPLVVEAPKAEPRLFSENADMPVFASAEGGSGVIILSTDPIEYVRRPYTLENISDAYAILITGDSMDPAFEPGDTAWVNPRLSFVRGCDVILYNIQDEQKATIKRLVSWTEHHWTLRQHNPQKTFKLARADWHICHRVVGKFSRR